MKDIAIYGAGGFGREVACVLKCINEVKPAWDLVGFFDDGKQIGDSTGFGPVLGGMAQLNSYGKPISVVFAIGSPQTVKILRNKVIAAQIDFPNIIAPDVRFLDKEHLEMGEGNLFCLGCTVTCHVRIGSFNRFNGYITIGHDVQMGDYNAVMPGSRISGEVKMGSYNFVGVNAAILQGVTIGDNTVVGANSVIIRNTKDGETYIGNPAKKFSF